MECEGTWIASVDRQFWTLNMNNTVSALVFYSHDLVFGLSNMHTSKIFNQFAEPQSRTNGIGLHHQNSVFFRLIKTPGLFEEEDCSLLDGRQDITYLRLLSISLLFVTSNRQCIVLRPDLVVFLNPSLAREGEWDLLVALHIPFRWFHCQLSLCLLHTQLVWCQDIVLLLVVRVQSCHVDTSEEETLWTVVHQVAVDVLVLAKQNMPKVDFVQFLSLVVDDEPKELDTSGVDIDTVCEALPIGIDTDLTSEYSRFFGSVGEGHMLNFSFRQNKGFLL